MRPTKRNQENRKNGVDSNGLDDGSEKREQGRATSSENESTDEPRKKKPKVAQRNRNQNKKRKLLSSSSDEDSSKSEEEISRKRRFNPRRATRVRYDNDTSDDSDSEKSSSNVDEYEPPDDAVELKSRTKIIDKVIARRKGKIGAVGSPTTTYAVEENGDPNEGCDPNDLRNTETHFLIKWKGSAYVHSTWESETSLKVLEVDTRSMRKLQEFVNKEENIADMKKRATPEDAEFFECEQELQQTLIDNYYIVERIIAMRTVDTREYYLAKWQSLPYVEATWEDDVLIERKWPDHVREFRKREESKKTPSKKCRALTQRPKFKQLANQPEYLAGGNPDAILRDYQLHGLNWLLHAWSKENSVILADEMGLGKTIQTIAFLHYLFHQHRVYGPFLVVVPLSTMTSWQREFALWAPDMNMVTYVGDVTSRKLIRKYEWCFANTHRPKFNVILTTYEILLRDKAILGSLQWAVLMVDEAHRLKNDDSLLYKVISEFVTYHRLLITGTPLQNGLRELWALLHYIMPSKFASWEEFEEDHKDAANQGFTSLHEQLEPFILRRVKKDVEKSLPAKIEQILRVEMSLSQKKFYRWILTKNFKALRKESKGSTTTFLNVIMQLRKCCNHSFLIEQPDFEISHRTPVEEQLQQLIKGSGKLILLDKLLMRLRETGHRVLIFSQMVRLLDILAEYLQLRRFPFQRLDGGMRSEFRKMALDHFNAENSQDFCFLLSTRAGGLGINLATADTVIIFDSDWNPQNDLQAQARAHRIGQMKQVNIYRLVTKNSVEEEMIERAKKKMILDHLIIQRMDTTGRTILDSKLAGTAATPFNKDELTAILKFGAAELFKNDVVGDEEPVCDIDEILRRAETRDDDPPATIGDELLSAFKMANFVTTEEEDEPPRENEIEDDPNEDWDEIIPKNYRARLEEEEKAKELADSYLPPKRIRKTIQNINKSDIDDESDNSSQKKLNDSVTSIDSEELYASSDEDSDDEESDEPVGRKKPHLNSAKLPYEKFTSKEIRDFVGSLKKFPAPMTQLEAVARDAKLDYLTIDELQKLGAYINERSNKLMNEEPQSSENGSIKMASGTLFTLGDVSVNAKKLLTAEKYLEPLAKILPANASERSSWTLNARVTDVKYADVDWSVEDDSKLLRGIYEHGMGNWEAIRDDPSLGLKNKILRAEGKPPGAEELKTRALYLMKTLGNEMGRNGAIEKSVGNVPDQENEDVQDAKHTREEMMNCSYDLSE